jgi:hypothetical protein
VNRWLLPEGANGHKVQGRDVDFLRSSLMKALTVLGRRVASELNQPA